MALEYDLHLATSMKPAQALEKLAGRLTGLERSEDRFFLFDTSVSICAIERTSESLKAAFHFNPTILVGFRRLFDADWDRFRQVLLDATLLLMDEAQDAVLLFNGERIEIQRFGGQLAFNAESGYWQDKDWLESRLPLPFEHRPLPSPLL
jgi:hypothetical protein